MEIPITDPEQLEMLSKLISEQQAKQDASSENSSEKPAGSTFQESPFDIQSILSGAVEALNGSENLSKDSMYIPNPMDEQYLNQFIKEESTKTVRRFDLNYPAKDGKDQDISLYIELEEDAEDPSYINYWVGCEEYTTKKYIASKQTSLEQEDPLSIVQVKHINLYIHEIQEATKEA